MVKNECWPKDGKLKKGLIILASIIVSSLLIVLLEEKTGFKHTKRIPFVIVAVCPCIWFYQPRKEENKKGS